MNLAELVNIARQAQTQAYAPYSGFRVGAALLGRDGTVFTGVNVENASYGLSICAERNAVFKAVTAGEREFVALAITSSGSGYVYPCGACLQVLAEFSPHIQVIVTDESDNNRVYDLSELLPQVFTWSGKQNSPSGGL
ncbi:MAG: cytidine deaminase [Syntrophomonadaceae bacterium]|nr:cytidine deaminase [Syntrophomonadaceae bacterium]